MLNELCPTSSTMAYIIIIVYEMLALFKFSGYACELTSSLAPPSFSILILHNGVENAGRSLGMRL